MHVKKCFESTVQRRMERNTLTINLMEAQLVGQVFDFVVDDVVFQKIDGLVTKGNIKSHVVCQKAEQTDFLFTIHSEGTVCVPCDRCLSDVELRIDTTDELKVKLGDTYEDDGDVLTVPSAEAFLDVSLPIYEFVVLSMPIKRTHEPGKCDVVMMEEFSKHQAARSSGEGTENNESSNGSDGEDAQPHDSRWDALAKLNH